MRPKYSIVVSNGWDKRLILEISPFDIPTWCPGDSRAAAHGVIRTAHNHRSCAEENQRGRQVCGVQSLEARKKKNQTLGEDSEMNAVWCTCKCVCRTVCVYLWHCGLGCVLRVFVFCEANRHLETNVLEINPSSYQSIFLSIYLSVHPFNHLSIYLAIY